MAKTVDAESPAAVTESGQAEVAAESKAEVVVLEGAALVAAERERRVYVRKSGGLRRGMGAKIRERAEELSKLVGVPIHEGWHSLQIPDFDQ